MRRALIADDYPENLYFLEVLLKANGFETVDLAANGAQALELARASRPDLIISDILMPVMDGYALCSKLKSDEQLQTIPFIFYTATFTTAKDEALALSLGADRFVIKPQEPDALMAIITQVLDSPHLTAGPSGDEIITEYSEVLFRKLEKKMADLETANRTLQEKHQELLKAYEAVECANQAKLRFLNIMSHELRTPLNAMLGNLQLSELDQAYHPEMAALAKSALFSMLELIDNMLEASRIESAAQAFSLAPLNLETVMAKLGRMFELAARNKGLNLRMSLAAELPRQIVADGLHLQQILVHLLNNAIKFTDQGQVEVLLKREPGVVPDRPMLKIEVKDSGIGIDPSKQQQVFELFTQADDSATRSYGGVGLGLYLTKRLVELMGGTISLQSEVGKGSTVTVRLPLVSVS